MRRVRGGGGAEGRKLCKRRGRDERWSKAHDDCGRVDNRLDGGQRGGVSGGTLYNKGVDGRDLHGGTVLAGVGVYGWTMGSGAQEISPFVSLVDNQWQEELHFEFRKMVEWPLASIHVISNFPLLPSSLFFCRLPLRSSLSGCPYLCGCPSVRANLPRCLSRHHRHRRRLCNCIRALLCLEVSVGRLRTSGVNPTHSAQTDTAASPPAHAPDEPDVPCTHQTRYCTLPACTPYNRSRSSAAAGAGPRRPKGRIGGQRGLSRIASSWVG
jgi:hypothetical protein